MNIISVRGFDIDIMMKRIKKASITAGFFVAPPNIEISNQTLIDLQAFSDLAEYSLDQENSYFG